MAWNNVFGTNAFCKLLRKQLLNTTKCMISNRWFGLHERFSTYWEPLTYFNVNDLINVNVLICGNVFSNIY